MLSDNISGSDFHAETCFEKLNERHRMRTLGRFALSFTLLVTVSVATVLKRGLLSVVS